MLDARLGRCCVLPMALLLLGACAGDHRDWAFVQSVGGMALGNLEPGRYGIQYAEPNGGTVDLGELRVAAAGQTALDASTQVGEWVGEQTISKPLQSDLEGLRERVRWVDARARSRFGNAALSGRLPDLDLLQRLVDAGGIGRDETFHLQSLGLVLGEVLVSELGFHWVIVEDKYGRDLAVKFKDTSVLVFPLTMISKRVERGERPDVRHIFESAKKDLPKYVERSDPKPG